jgi:hypothetical protein
MRSTHEVCILRKSELLDISDISSKQSIVVTQGMLRAGVHGKERSCEKNVEGHIS